MFSTNYYSVFPYDRSKNFDLVASHVAVTHGANEQPVEDFRFNEGIDYQGLGNSAIMRIHSCAALHLQMWCLKPSDSQSEKWQQWLIGVLAKPFAAMGDALMNTALFVMKVALIPIFTIARVFQKARHPNRNVDFWRTVGYTFSNAITHLDPLMNSYGNLMYQTVAAFSFNLLGAKYDLYHRLSDAFSWSYWVTNEQTGQDELILDTNRVKYIKEKCGWQNVADDVFTSLCLPLTHPTTAHIYYNGNRFRATWIHQHYR